MTNTEFDNFVIARHQNIKKASEGKSVMYTVKLEDCFDRMLYCRVTGKETECQDLYNKLKYEFEGE